MPDLNQYIVNVADFPRPGILFRDITPLLRNHFGETVRQMRELVSTNEWAAVDAVAGVESRGFILAAALAVAAGKGFVPIRKRGKLPPPVVSATYALEYGEDAVEMHPGTGRLLVVDDVVATGGTLRAACNLCNRAGYQITAMTALIDLRLDGAFHFGDMALRSVLGPA